MKCTYRMLLLLLVVAVVCTGMCVLVVVLGIMGDLVATGSLEDDTKSILPNFDTKFSVTSLDLKKLSQKTFSNPLTKGEGYLSRTIGTTTEAKQSAISSVTYNDRMVLAVVCCGDRVNETQVMLKSAAALSHTPLKLIVFTEDELMPVFRNMYESWPLDVQDRITLDLHTITFPAGQDAAMWRKLFKPCASQRLFMPSLLQEVEVLLYVDTDVLFLAPLEEVWRHFRFMNASHLAAMAPEHEDLATGWYNRFAKHPYYGRLGVNSGVMLMNLTRMREFGWEEYVVPIYEHYKLAITWGDQDIINIIFHFHPDKLFVYGCEYNFRPDHCMYMSVCKTAETRGIYVLHGSRTTFHTNKQPAFKAVYRAWDEYELDQDLRQNLYYPMQRYLLKATNTSCGKLHRTFLKSLGSMVRLR